MKTNIRSNLAGAFVIFVAMGSSFAQGGFGERSTVQEIQVGANTEYNVINNTNLFTVSPFTVVAFAVTSTGGDPFTSNPGWTAEKVDAAAWLQPMGGNPANASWADYTRMTYAQAFF